MVILREPQDSNSHPSTHFDKLNGAAQDKNCQIVKGSTSYCLIPQTPNRQAAALTVVGSVRIAIVADQEAVPSSG